MDRVVFSAPANKYAHIIGEPIFGGYGGDTGYSWLPFKLVDPAGNYLLEGTYNFGTSCSSFTFHIKSIQLS